MRNKKRSLLIVLCFLGFQILEAQQESQFTQYVYNQQFLNPAFSGIKKAPTLYALYRSQWIGYPGAPQSTLIGFNAPLLNERTGFGLLLSRQKIGIAKSWKGNMSYAYELGLTEKTSIRLGIQGSMKQLEIDFSDPAVIALEGNDPVMLENARSSHYLVNWGTGIYFTHPSFYMGLSIPNLRPNEIRIGQQEGRLSVSKEVAHLYLIGGYSYKLKESISLETSLLFKYVKNAPIDLDMGIRLNLKDKIVSGIAYRFGGNHLGESIDLSLLYVIRHLEIGLAYDLLISPLAASSVGSFEMLIRNTFRVEKTNTVSDKFPLQY